MVNEWIRKKMKREKIERGEKERIRRGGENK
jgi:hypothetical protein